jgi:TonB family protein
MILSPFLTRAYCLALGLLVATAAVAQDPAPSPAAQAAALSADPTTLLIEASRVNGLHGLPEPWHLRISFQVFDGERQTVDQGTLEEWWAGERKYKIAFNSSRFASTRYTIGDRTLILGERIEPVYPFNLILAALQNPLPGEAWSASMNLAFQDSTVDGEGLECVVAQSPLPGDPHGSPPVDRFCFQSGSPAVRLFDLGGAEYSCDSISDFQGRSVPHLLRITTPGKFAAEVDVRIDSLDALGPFPAGTFELPLQAEQPATPLPSSVVAGNRISGKQPQYPSSAKKKGIQGTVVLLATIGKDGKITDLEVVSGPPELQEPSVKAVRTWTYRPYLLNGEPVAVQTQINVTFALGH